MKKLKEIIGKNPMAWFFMVLLLISVAGNVVQQAYIQEHNPNMMKIVGTYATNDLSRPYPNTEYMVIESADAPDKAKMRYVHYKQTEILEKGTYSTEEEGIISLVSENQEQNGWIVQKPGKICWIRGDGAIELFDKTGDLPTYLGVDPDV